MTPEIVACIAAYLYIVGVVTQYHHAMLTYGTLDMIQDDADYDSAKRVSMILGLLWPLNPIIKTFLLVRSKLL